ncbi:MAG TPA: ATP-binding protein [Frankiaceae bacterium]|nr:ATP-binding protein [Frankiaceae bacterium]
MAQPFPSLPPTPLSHGVLPMRIAACPKADLGRDPARDDAAWALARRLDGSPRATLALPSSLRSPALARALVAEALRNCPTDVVDTALLLVSEVVTNAVRHAVGSPLIIGVETEPVLMVSVEDASPEPPVHDDAALDAESGRGLGLVDALATTWGWHRSSPGKVVWFELGSL